MGRLQRTTLMRTDLPARLSEEQPQANYIYRNEYWFILKSWHDCLKLDYKEWGQSPDFLSCQELNGPDT